MASLSKEKGLEPFPQWAFIGFNLHRNAGYIYIYIERERERERERAQQTLSGRNDQIIDNKELWVLILSQGQIVKGHKTLRNKLIPCMDPFQKMEGILSKAGYTGFYVFFLRPDCPR